MKNRYHLVLIFISFIATPFCLDTSDLVLDVGIILDKEYYGVLDKPLVYLEYTNNTSYTIKIPKRLVRTNEFWSDIFILRVKGESAKYLGKLVTYIPAGSPYKLKPGESVSRTIDLSMLYDLHEGGDYSIQACILINNKMHRSNVVEVFIEGRGNELKIKTDDTYLVEGMRLIGCSRNEALALMLAFPKAQDLVARAYSRLKPLKHSSDVVSNTQYKKWFCSDDNRRIWYNHVRNNWYKMNEAITTKTIKFHCGCSNAVAFVFPDKAYEIYVCRDFFKLLTHGKDSQAAVIVHELSHFYSTIGTKDYAYGYNTCLRLARDNPATAMRNADNYMFYSATYMLQ